jgi:hypothetical protein
MDALIILSYSCALLIDSTNQIVDTCYKRLPCVYANRSSPGVQQNVTEKNVPHHVTAPSQQQVTAHFLRDFEVKYPQTKDEHIKAVSVSSEGKLLAYVSGSCDLHVYEAGSNATSFMITNPSLAGCMTQHLPLTVTAALCARYITTKWR